MPDDSRRTGVVDSGRLTRISFVPAAIVLWLVYASPRESIPDPLIPIGRVRSENGLEISGIVASRSNPDLFWVHNDSGNKPELFGIRRDGAIAVRYDVAALNIDWEDVAVDDQGRVLLADIGNNWLRLPFRVIHRLDEPKLGENPGKPLQPRDASLYGFEATGRFNAEGLFVRDGRAVVVSKRSDGKEAELFEIPFDPPGTLLKPRSPRRLAALPGFVEPATGADFSRALGLLAVCSYNVVHVYEGSLDSPKLRATTRFPGKDVEAICWDGRDLLLVGESGVIYRLPECDWSKSVDDSR